VFRRLFARILVSFGALLVMTLIVGYWLGGGLSTRADFDLLDARLLIRHSETAAALFATDPDRRSPLWKTPDMQVLQWSRTRPDVVPAVDDEATVVKQALDEVTGDPARSILLRDGASRRLHVWIAVGDPDTGWVGQSMPTEPAGRSWLKDLGAIAMVVIVIIGTVFVAKGLSAPIERLAEQAEGLVRGQSDPALLTGAPREIRELAASLTQAGASRTNALRERELILAGLSHDLRTPLSRIRLALELGDAHTDEGRAAMAADIEEIDAIVRQFIDYVRSGREESPREVALPALVQDVVQANGGNLKNWTVHIHDVPLVTATPLALQRALANLVVNARRHAAPPYIATVVQPDPDHVAITITDEGTGIPLDLHRRIGEPFLTRDSRTRTGSGLGLAIVHRIIRRHGGRLELLARQPRGTMARIVLPIQTTESKVDEV